MKKPFIACALALVATAVLGRTLPIVDSSVRPGDNFYQYVNGAWMKATEIPPDRSSMSDGAALSEQADRRTREIIEETARDRSATADARKIADFSMKLRNGWRSNTISTARFRISRSMGNRYSARTSPTSPGWRWLTTPGNFR
jgi:predicted metalloendopeptidase